MEINIKTRLLNKNENEQFVTETKGTFENNNINYLDNDIETNIEILEDKVIVKRRNKEYNIEIPLNLANEEKGKYELSGLGEMNLKIKTTKLLINEDNIETEYEMLIADAEKIEFAFALEYTKEC